MDCLRNNTKKSISKFIAVRWRSQDESNRGVTLEEVHKIEEDFFEKHEKLSDIAEFQGIKYLRSELSKLLQNKIKECFPELKRKINNLLDYDTDVLIEYWELI